MTDGKVTQNGTILLTIARVETKQAKNGNMITSVWNAQNKKHSYYVLAEDGTWGQQLMPGAQVYVSSWDNNSTINGRPITYHNISKPRDPVPPVPIVGAQGIPVSPPPALPEPPPGFFESIPPEAEKEVHVTYTSDKDIKIRWMNAMNNAVQIVAGLDLKKLGEPQIKNYIIEYANFFNTLESGMTIETIPISKAQTIRLHELMIAWGVDKQEYHNILSRILDKTVSKTTDLTYAEAVKCIADFDVQMKTGEGTEEKLYDPEPEPGRNVLY